MINPINEGVIHVETPISWQEMASVVESGEREKSRGTGQSLREPPRLHREFGPKSFCVRGASLSLSWVVMGRGLGWEIMGGGMVMERGEIGEG